MKTRLICFPFAGGNKYSYLSWNSLIPEHIEMMAFEGPGRGDRYSEPLLEDMEHVLEDYWRQVNSLLNEPYAFYGHSMGAMVSFLLSKRAIEEGYAAPKHVFLSGRVPPTWPDEGDKLWRMDYDGFWAGIKAYGGSPEELLKRPELMQLYEPMIRADLKSLDSYNHPADARALNIPATVLLGTREKVTMESAPDWQKQFQNPIQIHQFEGNHFWILQHGPQIIDIINKALS
jgi:surfactin synthase thioesterase subunit